MGKFIRSILKFLGIIRRDKRLFIVSGPSGCGKTTIMRSIGWLNEVVSTTTRKIRVGEVHGKDYFFITDEEFNNIRRSNGLAEDTSYYGSAQYGATKKELGKKLKKGDTYIIVDVNGKRQLKELYPNAVSIFIFTSEHEARERMVRRGDTPEQIEKRIITFNQEMNNAREYDYFVYNINGGLKASIRKIKKIVGERNPKSSKE